MKQISDQKAHEIQTRERGTTAQQVSTIAHLESLTKAEQARKLKLTLELVKQKTRRHIALSVSEEELLAECNRRFYSKEKETISVDASGSVHVQRTVDASPIMAAMKDYADIIGNQRNERLGGARLIGSIDNITAANWAKESGFAVGTSGFAAFSKKRIQNDIDYRKFRVGH
tara:strand:- start:33101 stop:33616 length:516 start_codon:yes stop_codon:yes gene_type:complete